MGKLQVPKVLKALKATSSDAGSLHREEKENFGDMGSLQVCHHLCFSLLKSLITNLLVEAGEYTDLTHMEYVTCKEPCC